MNLYPFQREAIAFHLAHPYSLNFSEMGTGKTRVALATAKAVGGELAVFGPAFLKETWAEEGRVAEMPHRYFAYSQLHKLKPKDLEGYTFWVADEVHCLKNPSAIRTASFHTLLCNLVPAYFLGLTGTPIKNRVPDIWTLLGFLNSSPTQPARLNGHLKSYYAFSRHFCFIEKFTVNGRQLEKYKGIRPERVAEFRALLKGAGVRYKVDDVLAELPPMTRTIISHTLQLTSGLMEAFEAYQAGSKYNISAKVNSALLKAPATIEYCQTLQEGSSGPLLVFTDHLESARLMADNLGGYLVTGETHMEVRADLVKQFQAGYIPVLIATIGALSLGVTLTAARHVVFNDLSWVPANNAQAEKRIHRIGQKEVCFAHYIDATPTDAYIRKMLFQKMETIVTALEGV